MGEVDQLPAAAPVDPVQAYRDAMAYAGMLRQSALGSAADIAYHEAVLKSAVGLRDADGRVKTIDNNPTVPKSAPVIEHAPRLEKAADE
jgi:hypothetical protein